MSLTVEIDSNESISLTIEEAVETSLEIADSEESIILEISSERGPAGVDGNSIRANNGAPSNSLGVDGDLYVNSANGDLFKRVSGSYTIIGNIKGTAGPNTIDSGTSTELNGVLVGNGNRVSTLGYDPESISNKETTFATSVGSDAKYPSVKAVYTWVLSVVANYAPINALADFALKNLQNLEGDTLISVDILPRNDNQNSLGGKNANGEYVRWAKAYIGKIFYGAKVIFNVVAATLHDLGGIVSVDLNNRTLNSSDGEEVLNFSDSDGATTITQPKGSKSKSLANCEFVSKAIEDIGVGTAPVTSVNGETGSVVLDYHDVGAQAALGYTPEDVANKNSSTLSNYSTEYPSAQIVNTHTKIRSFLKC